MIPGGKTTMPNLRKWLGRRQHHLDADICPIEDTRASWYYTVFPFWIATAPRLSFQDPGRSSCRHIERQEEKNNRLQSEGKKDFSLFRRVPACFQGGPSGRSPLLSRTPA